MSREDWEAEIRCWQEVFAHPEKYSWGGFKYITYGENKVAYRCKICGRFAQEHNGGPHEFQME